MAKPSRLQMCNRNRFKKASNNCGTGLTRNQRNSCISREMKKLPKCK